MDVKVYISKNNTATFVCPNCENTTTADVTRYAKMDKTVRVNIKCRCGQNFNAVLEKRRRYRKNTRLPGTYTYERPDGSHPCEGMIARAKAARTRASCGWKISPAPA